MKLNLYKITYRVPNSMVGGLGTITEEVSAESYHYDAQADTFIFGSSTDDPDLFDAQYEIRKSDVVSIRKVN